MKQTGVQNQYIKIVDEFLKTTPNSATAIILP